MALLKIIQGRNNYRPLFVLNPVKTKQKHHSKEELNLL
jgi:hypothetical protein